MARWLSRWLSAASGRRKIWTTPRAPPIFLMWLLFLLTPFFFAFCYPCIIPVFLLSLLCGYLNPHSKTVLEEDALAPQPLLFLLWWEWLLGTLGLSSSLSRVPQPRGRQRLGGTCRLHSSPHCLVLCLTALALRAN